jgi:predicted GNAT superfamily acetyltransferase
MDPPWYLKILETPQEMESVEELQRLVWPGSETEIVPVHLLVTAVHNGGLAIGAFQASKENGQVERLVGFVFGFVGLYYTPDGPRPKHCSHMLGVDPALRDQGLGFTLKRAQWQMVRHQGIDRITWTYDPLLSRNAHLNIARLGAVCNTYRREVYGQMRDGLNMGLPSDRFEVDWWVNTQRVQRRLSRQARPRLDLAHFLAAGARIVNPTQGSSMGWPLPAETQSAIPPDGVEPPALLLVEIPADFQALRSADLALALRWRLHIRAIFEDLFASGYLVTDFAFLPGREPRSFYVLSHGDSTF